MTDLSSNIPSTIVYGCISSEILQIARWALKMNDFISRASDLFSRMIAS